MVSSFIRTTGLAILVGICCVGFSSSIFAQDTGGGGGGGDGGGGQTGGDIGNQIPGTGTDPIAPTQTGDNQGGGDTSISQGEGLGEIRTFQIDQSEDTRNQGFVGATAPEVRDGFVGAATSGTGSPLADGATFGGGVNNSVNSQFTGGSNAGARGGQQAGFGAAQNGVTITRRSIRARLRPSFSAPRPSGKQVAVRFNDHFYRQPGSENVTGQYTINVQNRTAFLDGTVNNGNDVERLVRQLRLEPGVYKVVNRLKVATQ